MRACLRACMGVSVSVSVFGFDLENKKIASGIRLARTYSYTSLARQIQWYEYIYIYVHVYTMVVFSKWWSHLVDGTPKGNQPVWAITSYFAKQPYTPSSEKPAS